MPYFHATWAENIPSILKNGLGGAAPVRPNFDNISPGVYLCIDAVISLYFLYESLALRSDMDHEVPSEVLARMRIIVIDDSRVDPRLLTEDPEIERSDLTKLYRGCIDVAGMPVLGVDDVLPPEGPGAIAFPM